jgi:hypothetical protein
MTAAAASAATTTSTTPSPATTTTASAAAAAAAAARALFAHHNPLTVCKSIILITERSTYPEVVAIERNKHLKKRSIREIFTRQFYNRKR